MMQAAEGGNSSTNSYGVYSSSNVTEDEYENQPLLSQHHPLGATRRRGGSGMPQTPQDDNLQHNNNNHNLNDDKYDKGNSYYSDAIPCRPTLTSIKSISRIGRSISPSIANTTNGDGDFDDAVLTSNANNHGKQEEKEEEYYYDDQTLPE